MVNLKPGKYWFFGHNENANLEEIRSFYEFLDQLPLQYGGMSFDTGSTEKTATGLFYFEIELFPDETPELVWLSSMYDIDYHKVLKDPDYVFLSPANLIDYVYSISLQFDAEITECNETCVFYWFCDRNRKSDFNPSISLGISCEKFCLNKHCYSIKYDE